MRRGPTAAPCGWDCLEGLDVGMNHLAVTGFSLPDPGSGPVGEDKLHGPLEPIRVKDIVARVQGLAVRLLEMLPPVRSSAIRIGKPVLVGKIPRTEHSARFFR